MSFDSYRLAWLFKETMGFLERYASRVNEGKDIQAASEYARWLRMSGLLSLFEANPQAAPHLVDHKLCEKAIVDLLFECAEQWKRGAVGKIQVSELELIHHRLDLIAGAVAQLMPAENAKEALLAPPLRLIQGGKG